MKKKESIFYEANSFPSPGPEILELKADNKGNVIEEGFQGLEVQLTERKIKNFWKKMDEIDIWNWEKNYSIGEICDGHMWKIYIRNKEGKAKVVNGHQEYPHNFNKLIKALNNLFGSKIETIEDLNTENEVIELEALYDSGPVFISLHNNKGFVNEFGEITEVKIDEFKKQNFWKNIDELGVWNWHNKYPHKEPMYQPPTCQVNWKLKITNHDKAKYCSGYYFFPRNFKKFIKELSDLMGIEIKI
ncbi:hypothetical protein N9A34_03720 [Candidatus Pelagibacter sp.]|nr:hypothetical protein [Candidatus Pelagibacter sp.]